MSKALKTAIEANDPDAARKAIKPVKDINRKHPGSQSPLYYTCAKRSLDSQIPHSSPLRTLEAS